MQEYAFTKRCCFLTFSFEGKFRKYDIFVKRKHTKTNENMIFSVLFTNFRKTKILIFMQSPGQGKITIHDPKIYFVKDILSHFAPGYAKAPYKSMYSK